MEELVLRFGFVYILSVFILYFCFKRFIYSILDPFTQILLLFASLIALSSDHILLIYIITCVITFWIGMYVVFPERKIQRNFEIQRVGNILTLRLYTYFLFFIYFILIIYIFYTSGIPLFADNPTKTKISVFEGYGMIRRIVFIGSSIIPVNLIILTLVSHKKRTHFFLLILFCLLKILQGSKSSLLGVILPAVYLLTQKNLLPFNVTNIRKKKSLIIGGFIVITILLLFIVKKESEIEGGTFIYSLGFRLMEFGDISLYYKMDNIREYFSDYNFLDYLSDELNGILGMLRIVPYKYPLGFLMVKQYLGYTPDVVVGPNGIFIIKGDIYFGYFGGLLYSFICGYIFAKIRKYYFSMRINDIFWYSLMTTIFFSLGGFLRESAQFYSLLFDIVFFSFPFLFISQCLSKLYGRPRRIKK